MKLLGAKSPFAALPAALLALAAAEGAAREIPPSQPDVAVRNAACGPDSRRWGS